MNWTNIVSHALTIITLYLVFCIYQDVRDVKKILRGEVSDETMNEFARVMLKGAEELRKEKKGD